MMILKILLQTIFIFSVLYTQTKITIYNQGRAFISEIKEVNLKQRGKQTLIISDIPNTVDPASINLLSDNIRLISKEFIYNPITNQSLLDALIGQKIELVKYGEDGNISFSTMGKLISNIKLPIFEIEGKIVVDPPYSYRFHNIPEGLSDNPYMNCIIESKTRENDYHLSYLTTGLDWEAEYNLKLKSDKICDIEGWYLIRNDLNFQYEDAEIALVSGEVNFEEKNSGAIHSNKRMKTASSYSSDITSPIITEIGEYAVFNLYETINLKPKSQIRHQFISKSEIPYKNIYHISHSMHRYRRNSEAKSQSIPVYVRLELNAEDIGKFQIPSGSYKVYGQNEDALTYIGVGSSSIVEASDKIKLETGKSHDILCTFTIKGYEINRDVGEAEINAVFDNRKDRIVTIIWTEFFSDGRWDILNSNSDYIRLDAFSAQFNVEISAHEKKEISFKARIEKI